MGVWRKRGPFVWYHPLMGRDTTSVQIAKLSEENGFGDFGLEMEVTLNSNSNEIKFGRASPHRAPPGDLYLEPYCCEVTAIEFNPSSFIQRLSQSKMFSRRLAEFNFPYRDE